MAARWRLSAATIISVVAITATAANGSAGSTLPAIGANFRVTQSATPASASLPNTTTSASRPKLSNEEMGDLYMIRKSYDDAVDSYYRALQEQGFKNSKIWNKLGIAYEDECSRTGCFGRARKAFQQAIHHDRRFASAWNNLGTTFYLDQKAKRSIKDYKRAIKLRPKVATYHLNLGTAEYRIKKYPAAFNEFRKAIALDPNLFMNPSPVGNRIETTSASSIYYFYLAKAFASLGQNKEAIRYLRHAMEDGFDNTRKIEHDADLKKLSGDPAFVELLKNPPVPITR